MAVTKQSIYVKVLNELEKRYIFTRSGLERRYNNLLKLKQSAQDRRLIKLIEELLNSYKDLRTEWDEIDLDSICMKDIHYICPPHSYKELTAIMNSKFSRANLRNYCMEAEKHGCHDIPCGVLNQSLKPIYNKLYTTNEVETILRLRSKQNY